MKRCDNCPGEFFIFLSYQGQNLCKSCFSRLIERRIRLNLRNKRIISEKPLLVVDNSSAAYGATKFVLSKISESMPKLKVVFSEKPKRGFRKIICRSLEEECISYLKAIFMEEKSKMFPNPTSDIPQSELEKFCKIKGIRYKEHKYSQIDSGILGMLSEILKMRPGAMFSLQKISERLR